MKYQKRRADALAQATLQRQRLAAVKAASYLKPPERCFIDVEKRIAEWSAYVRQQDAAYYAGTLSDYRGQAAHAEAPTGATTGRVIEESTPFSVADWKALQRPCPECQVNTTFNGCFCTKGSA